MASLRLLISPMWENIASCSSERAIVFVFVCFVLCCAVAFWLLLPAFLRAMTSAMIANGFNVIQIVSSAIFCFSRRVLLRSEVLYCLYLLCVLCLSDDRVRNFVQMCVLVYCVVGVCLVAAGMIPLCPDFIRIAAYFGFVVPLMALVKSPIYVFAPLYAMFGYAYPSFAIGGLIGGGITSFYFFQLQAAHAASRNANRRD